MLRGWFWRSNGDASIAIVSITLVSVHHRSCRRLKPRHSNPDPRRFQRSSCSRWKKVLCRSQARIRGRGGQRMRTCPVQWSAASESRPRDVNGVSAQTSAAACRDEEYRAKNKSRESVLACCPPWSPCQRPSESCGTSGRTDKGPTSTVIMHQRARHEGKYNVPAGRSEGDCGTKSSPRHLYGSRRYK
jgi:hypothetical protein